MGKVNLSDACRAFLPAAYVLHQLAPCRQHDLLLFWLIAVSANLIASAVHFGLQRCVEAAISELRTRGSSIASGGVGPLMRPHVAAAGLGTAPAAHMYGAMGR